MLLVMSLYFFMADTPPSLEGAIYTDASRSIDERIEDLLMRMTLDEKIGQMALVEKNSVPHIEDVATYGLGAILSGAGGKPEDNTPAGWKTMIARYVDESRTSRTGIPIFYGLDANHGHSNVPGATIFPHAIGLGAADDAALVTDIARATAREAAATGARWIYSPSLDLPADIRWGRVYETFSDDPERTAKLGAAYVAAIEETAAASAKHYPGIGGMLWQTSTNKNFSIDQGAITADEIALRSAYLQVYRFRKQWKAARRA